MVVTLNPFPALLAQQQYHADNLCDERDVAANFPGLQRVARHERALLVLQIAWIGVLQLMDKLRHIAMTALRIKVAAKHLHAPDWTWESLHLYHAGARIPRLHTGGLCVLLEFALYSAMAGYRGVGTSIAKHKALKT